MKANSLGNSQPFLKIESAFHACKAHLDLLSSDDPDRAEIEFYLVAGLIMLIVSEYEELIERMFADRANLCGDTHVACYVRKNIAQKFRSPDLGKITDTLGKFGSDYRQAFSAKLLNTEYHAAWDNILRARHAIVHKSGPLSITFGELLSSYPKTKTVLTELRNTLGIA